MNSYYFWYTKEQVHILWYTKEQVDILWFPDTTYIRFHYTFNELDTQQIAMYA